MAGMIALYLRVSKDDDERDESNSIANQRALLRAYAASDPALAACEIIEFADDGWSGTNFDRPRVRELLDLARAGGVRHIIVKDLSRWGRNYIEVNEYIEQIFPFLGIRFISVNDHYDSNDYRGATAPVDVAFRSLVHDIYSRELSVKVNQSLDAKARKGEHVCGHPPFGYIRSSAEKNRLVIDEEAAAVIRHIFDMARKGMSGVKIAAALNEAGVDSPLAWRRRTGRTMLGMKVDAIGVYWGAPQIVKIIRDERYTGTLVCFKSKKEKVGGKKAVRVPKNEWLRIPDAHPAIISPEQFSDANEKLRRNNRREDGKAGSNRAPFPNLKFICGHCNKGMRWMRCQESYYFCEGPKLKKDVGCFEGKVHASLLKEIILASLQTEARKIYDEDQLRKRVVLYDSSGGDDAIVERKQLMAQITMLERRVDALYEEYADSKLDKDSYLAAKAARAREIAHAKDSVSMLDTRIAESVVPMKAPVNDSLLRRVLDAEDITDEVASLIDSVVIYDSERIEVRFAFGDVLKEVSI